MREVSAPTLHDLSFAWRASWIPSTGRVDSPLPGVQWVGSGKGALALILRYLRQNGVLSDKLSEVLVPDWIGYWVYNQIQEFAFPAKRLSERTKVILVYHQYGFPQNMETILAYAREHKLIVIEDCAHALAGAYQDKPLGTFGDFAIYSYSKFFFCLALGGVGSKHADFMSFAERQIKASGIPTSLFKDLVKLLAEWNGSSAPNWLSEISTALMSMSYALYGRAFRPNPIAIAMARAKFEGEIRSRQKYYADFRRRTDALGLCDHLPKDHVAPYVIPIRCARDRGDTLLQKMAGRRIRSGWYHFDVERNMLHPRFEPVIWIPCHAGIHESQFNELTEMVYQTFA